MPTQSDHRDFQIPGMKAESNPGRQGGTNYRFDNGWVVTVRGDSAAPQALVFVSYRGLVRDIREIIECQDRREDDKLFLSRAEIKILLTTVSRLRSSDGAPQDPLKLRAATFN